MPEYSNYLESLDPVVGALSGDEIIGASKDGDAVSLTAQQIADLGGGGVGTVTSVTGTSNRITSTGGATPVIDISAAYDAAITAQIDAAVSGVEYKDACNYKTVAPLAANVYNNGSSGVGATLTGVGFGALSFDGSTPVVGNSVLVDQEVAGANNGIYTVTTVGGVATVYVLTRRGDFNQSSDIEAGDATYILGGATKGNTTWVMTTTGTITVGTTALTFVQVQGIGSVPDATSSVKGIVELADNAETLAGSDSVRAVVPSGLASTKDATGGFAGLTLFKINFKNALNTFTSFFTNANTSARTYTFQNRDGTIADDTDLALKQALVNTAVAITDASTMDITAIKHTLTTSSATRTFTISYTGDDISMRVILNATSSVFTFPAGALCISEGVAQGNNTCPLGGVSGDKYVFAIKNWGGGEYTVVCKNEGQ